MISGIVLAGGASRRLGYAKQLIEIDRETLVRRTARLVRAAQVDRVGVVIGARADEITATLAGLDVELIVNPAWDEGMASSVRAGIAWARGSALITVCDQPLLTTAHLDALIDSARDGAIVGSAYGGAIGVPAVFPPSSFAALSALTGDRGARSLLVGQRAVAWEPGALDVDEASDLTRLRNLKPDR